LYKECNTGVQEWWAQYLEEIPLFAVIVPEEMRDDYWLESYFQEMVQDVGKTWIAEVTTANEKKLALRYFHYAKNCENEKIWKIYNTTGSCGPGNVLCHFGMKDHQIFTKKQTIRLASYRKIQQAYYIYTGKHLNKEFLPSFFYFDFIGMLISFSILIFLLYGFLETFSPLTPVVPSTRTLF
jgi:hypothetical protein